MTRAKVKVGDRTGLTWLVGQGQRHEILGKQGWQCVGVVSTMVIFS